MQEYVLELKNITKKFPGVIALDSVSFQLKKGEIHALMGENGAGKSTFIKIITGVQHADDGQIYLYGNRVTFDNSRIAHKMGIAAIYQHVTCYPDLSITENIFLGHEKISRMKRICWKDMHIDALMLLKSIGFEIDPRTEMGALSVAQQQMVEIAKALSSNSKILIMDEPTASLSDRECQELYKISEKLRDTGVSIIFISHRFEDIYRLASRITVFRDAKYIGTWNIGDIKKEDLIVAMVGRTISAMYPKKEVSIGDEIFRVENLSKIGYFNDVSFTLKKGEILGLTGLVGARRTELCLALYGVLKPDKGLIYIDGKTITPTSPFHALSLGIGYIPEDRQKEGLLLEWSIRHNVSLASLSKFSVHGFLNKELEEKHAKIWFDKLNIKALDSSTVAKSLSGGNQQKVVFAKFFGCDIKIFIFDEPTKGVDVGAKFAIYELIMELALAGHGIIIVSSEMPEILAMSDRILVMREGKITGEFSHNESTQDKILTAAMRS